MSTANHVHYDLAALERDMRANWAAAEPRNEFERCQAMGNEVSIQFALFEARMENEGASEKNQLEASCAVISALIENMAAGFEGDPRDIKTRLLSNIAQYVLRGGEVVAVTDMTPVKAGHA